jgi:hypothetical protein
MLRMTLTKKIEIAIRLTPYEPGMIKWLLHSLRKAGLTNKIKKN